jgi:hypothetical protein
MDLEHEALLFASGLALFLGGDFDLEAEREALFFFSLALLVVRGGVTDRDGLLLFSAGFWLRLLLKLLLRGCFFGGVFERDGDLFLFSGTFLLLLFLTGLTEREADFFSSLWLLGLKLFPLLLF